MHEDQTKSGTDEIRQTMGVRNDYTDRRIKNE